MACASDKNPHFFGANLQNGKEKEATWQAKAKEEEEEI